MQGRFLVFEGPDGAGKSSQLERLAQRVEGLGREVVRLVEPTHGPIGSEIRRRAQQGPPLSAQEELDLFVEDRRGNVRDAIEPALARGAVVIQDRYFYSTAAYQAARDELGLSPAEVLELHAWAPRPDRVLLLDLPTEVGLARVAERGAGDAFEREDRQRKVREHFLAMAEGDPAFRRVDASRPRDAVAAAVWAEVADLFGEEDA
ncbi:MAG: dTMP kinase [Planctomycetes bacterium]|nr:dTMP kinase [Planctomycetota bacterium]